MSTTIQMDGYQFVCIVSKFVYQDRYRLYHLFPPRDSSLPSYSLIRTCSSWFYFFLIITSFFGSDFSSATYCMLLYPCLLGIWLLFQSDKSVIKLSKCFLIIVMLHTTSQSHAFLIGLIKHVIFFTYIFKIAYENHVI
jgi:hypothetical protein